MKKKTSVSIARAPMPTDLMKLVKEIAVISVDKGIEQDRVSMEIAKARALYKNSLDEIPEDENERDFRKKAIITGKKTIEKHILKIDKKTGDGVGFNLENGDFVIMKPTIVQIIQELVNHFGGEPLEKIVISDIDTRIKKVMKWTGDKPLYLINNSYTTEPPENVDEVETIETGQDAGFIYSDFYYPGELIGDAGNSVVTILDKIKNMLGEFEYFYDLDGRFVFQKK